jgi:hypothetical protein
MAERTERPTPNRSETVAERAGRETRRADVKSTQSTKNWQEIFLFFELAVKYRGEPN